jgi:hypothetical protein
MKKWWDDEKHALVEVVMAPRKMNHRAALAFCARLPGHLPWDLCSAAELDAIAGRFNEANVKVWHQWEGGTK